MDILLLAQNEQVTGWLTPVWMISVGITIGFIIALLVLGLMYVLSRISPLNRLNDNVTTRIISGLLLTVLVLAGFIGYSIYSGMWDRMEAGRDQLLFVMFAAGTSVLVGFGLIAFMSRRRFDEILDEPRGGFARWLATICVASALFAVIGYGLAMVNGFGYVTFVDNPNSMFNSLSRLHVHGVYPVQEITIDGNSTEELEVNFWGQELSALRFRSDQRVDFAVMEVSAAGIEQVVEISPARDEETFTLYRKQFEDSRFPNEFIPKLYFENQNSGEAKVELAWALEVDNPQVSVIPQTAITVVSVFLLYWIFCALFPKIAAIATSTFKTEVSQPVFILLAIIGTIFAVGTIYLPYNTFGEDIKMYKLSGLTLIRIMGIFMAIWAASKSVAEEIEGRTALTVLSKPVGRRQFILGKFSGIALAIGLLFILLGFWFVIWVCYKPIYDEVETSTRNFVWTNGFNEAMKTIPGLVLAYMEALVFVAISIAISTRMGILPNFMICFSIYILGHLTPLIVQSAEVAQVFEGVAVFGQFISVIFPVLDHFDVEPAIIGEVDVPIRYLGWAFVYCLIYGTIAMLLSLVFFEDRDLA